MKQPKPRKTAIVLGTASRDTKGPLGTMIEAAGLWHKNGIDTD